MSEHRERCQQLSQVEVVLSLIKCSIGAGSFVLPKAFADGGILASVVLIVLISATSAYTIWEFLSYSDSYSDSMLDSNVPMKLLSSEESEGSLATRLPSLSIPDMVGTRFTWTCKETNVAKLLVQVLIFCTVVIITGAYIDFCTGLCGDLAESWGKHILHPSSYAFLILPVELFFCSLDNVKSLMASTAIGNAAVILGCMTVVIIGLGRDQSESDSALRPNITINTSGLPSSIGKLVFLLGIHIVAVPLVQRQNNVSSKKKTLLIAFSALALFNCLFGFFGYVLFLGEDIQDNILLNLPQGSVPLDVIKVFVLVDLLCTFPLVFSVAMDIVEKEWDIINYIHHKYFEQTSLLHATKALRMAITLLPFLFAMAIPSFADLVALAGVVCVVTGYWFPPLLNTHLLLFSPHVNFDSDTAKWLVVDALIFGFGTAVLFLTVYSLLE